MEKELLKWRVTAPRYKIVQKRNWIIMILLFFVALVVPLFTFPPNSLEFYKNYYLPFAIAMLAIYFLWAFLSHPTFEFTMTNNGVSKIDTSRSGKIGAPKRLYIGYERFLSQITGRFSSTMFYFPYKAVAYYKINGDVIQLIPKIRTLSFVIITNNNTNKVISILNKNGIKEG